MVVTTSEFPQSESKSESWKWSKSPTLLYFNCFSVSVCSVFACQVTSLIFYFLPLFLLLCDVWKMMQCHVDACDDMQPPELVSVLNLFFWKLPY